MYNHLFGKDYVPEPYVEKAYKYALITSGIWKRA
jgi:hypothetical protein